MKKVYVMLAEGFEEIEALTVVDVLRRGEVFVEMVSITEDEMVTGGHGITVKADKTFSKVEDVVDCIVLPGGLLGTMNLKEKVELMEKIKKQYEEGRYVAAICAAPALILGELGLLQGKKATCYPQMEEHMKGAIYDNQSSAVQDGTIITACSMGGAIDFSLQILEALLGEEKSTQIRESLVIRG